MDDTAGDAALVQAVRDGNTDAFAQLLVRHWPLLLSLSRRMLGDTDLAHDVAVERSELDPVDLTPIRVLFRRERKTTSSH